MFSTNPHYNYEKIYSYLKMPTNEGLWFLNIKEDVSAGIFSEINSRLNNLSATPNKSVSPRLHNAVKNNIKTYKEYTTQWSTLFYSFKQFVNAKLNIETESSAHHWSILYEVLGLEEIIEKMPEALEFYQNEIYCDLVDGVLYYNEISKIKDGFVIVIESSINGQSRSSSFVSLDKCSILKIQEFVKFLSPSIYTESRKIYSPEEIIFKPYFALLNASYKEFEDNLKIQSLLSKSIKEFSDESFTYSINTLGQIFEEYLTQVYETIFRDAIYDKLTIGQLYDTINSKISRYLEMPKKEKPDPKLLYDKIKVLLEKKKEDSEYQLDVETTKLIRETIKFISDDGNYIMEHIKPTKNENRIFPLRIQHHITEFIKYRNAVSHNTRIPVGEYEALRAIYCIITFIIWWKQNLKAVDWDQPVKDVVALLIKNSKE